MQPLIFALTLAVAAPAHDGSHDFDAEFGTWNVVVERLTSGSHWVRYSGTHVVRPLWNGRANIGVLEIQGPSGHIEGMQLRLYDPAAHVWRLSFASSTNGQLQPPMTGAFQHGIGEFSEVDHVNGKTVITRAVSTPLNATSYRDVISSSTDNGKSWTTSWIAIYHRAH